MKKIIFILSALVIMLTSCEKDNYDAPDAMLTGRVVYNGEAVGLKNGEVTVRLYEPGWELSSTTYINISVAQDGTFSASVFGGKTYKLVRVANIGPWENPTAADTITVKVDGNTEVDIPVTPYFSISASDISITNGVVNATMSVKQNSASSTIESVGLYVASNMIVDANNCKVKGEHLGAVITDLNNIHLSANLTDAMKKEGYLFARVGVKTVGVSQLIYSVPVKINVN